MPLIVKCALVSLLFLPLIVYLVIGFDGSGGRQGEQRREPKPVQPDLEHMLTFHDRGGGYQIQYPSNWTLDDNTAANQMIRANIGQGETVGFQIRMYDDVKDEFDEYVDWYADQFIEDMRGHWGGEMSVVGRAHGLILDIKPYVKYFDSRDDAVSVWVDKHFADGNIPHGVIT